MVAQATPLGDDASVKERLWEILRIEKTEYQKRNKKTRKQKRLMKD